jgi:Tol biopolymer transport system component/PKD repeat protein
MSALINTLRGRAILALAGVVLVLAVLAPSYFAQESTEEPQPPTAVATEAPTEDPTEVPTEVVTEAPPEVATEVPAEGATEVVTEEPTAAPTATQRPSRPTRPGGGLDPDLVETFCRLNVTNNGDQNPYTFLFTASAGGIASFAWTFGDATTSNVQNPPVKTYTASGSYPITLTCTPTVGSPIVLTGSVTVSPVIAASFIFPGGDERYGLPPFTVATTNTSTGGAGLTYVWKVSGSSNPSDPGLSAHTPNPTTTNISRTITSADFVEAGFGANGPAVIWFHLTATDPGSGLTATASRSVSFTPPAPLYNFTLTPTEVSVGGSVTVQAVDQGGGPVTGFNWTFTGGSPATATGPGPHVITYNTAGAFGITMTYTGPGGGGSASKSVNVFDPADPVDAGITFLSSSGPGNAIVACFENTSTGPFVRSTWNFTPAPTVPATVPFVNNDPIVCVTFGSGGSVTAELEVVDQEFVDNGGVIGQSSTATLNVVLTASPIADYTFSPVNPVTQGSNVNFTDTSNLTGGGPVTSWLWQYNDGGVLTTFSSVQNPSGINFSTVGERIIRLTVTGPGGSSFVEKIIAVTRREIGCSITPTTNPILPTTGNQAYAPNITQALGRTITYAWTLTDSAGTVVSSGSTANFTVNWGAQAFGNYVLRLVATTPDGSVCEAVRGFTRAWPEINCTIVATVPSPLYPVGGTLTFTANVAGLNGRTVQGYQWFVNNVLQSETSATFTYTVPNDSTIAAAQPQTVRYVVLVDNNTAPTTGYVPATATCEETNSFNVVPWPDVTCNAASISGNFNPVPLDGTTGAQQTHTYTVTPNGLAGRSNVTYTWTVNGGTITAGQGTATVTVAWDPTRASEIPPAAPRDEELSVVVTVTNPDGISDANDTCSAARTGGTDGIGAQYASLICNAPTGDDRPVMGEFANYAGTLSNTYGRPITSIVWTLERENLPLGSGVWVPVATTTITDGSFPNFTAYQYLAAQSDENRNFRVRYSAVLAAANGFAGDTCTSGNFAIQTYGVGDGFQCESPNPFLIGSGTPQNNGQTGYNTNIDNTTGLDLSYVWTLVDRNSTVYPLYSYNSTVDGLVYLTNNGTAGGTPLTLAQLGPIGPGTYTLRLNVSDPSGTATTVCNLQRTLVVGFVDAIYTYSITGGWTNNALPVNAPICLTNTSTHQPPAPVPPSVEAVQYTWTLPAGNSLGITTATTENLPGCFSFATPGNYTVSVQIRNAEGNLTDTYSLVFSVYGLQGISINRTGDNFNSSQSFTSTGTNITNMNLNDWVFDRLTPTSNPSFATRNNVQNPNNVTGFTPGTYRATVTGTGPLGNTSASLEFEILAPNGLTARFTPSQWAGVAPMEVCFTDRSISGSPITSWEWDLDGDGLYERTGQNPGCFTYPNPGMVVQTRLRVTNSSFTRTATNTVRTYTPVEANQNFRIVPQGGMSFCFVPEVVNSTASEWRYGDGNTLPVSNNNQVCHTYASSGTYLVDMCFTSPLGNGCVTRPVTVTGNPPPTPTLSPVGACMTTSGGGGTFTITNTGAAMTSPDTVRVRDAGGSTIYLGPLQLGSVAPGNSATFNFPNRYGLLTLTTTDVSLTVNTNCTPPNLTAVAVCVVNATARFTITNSSADSNASQPYQILDSGNNVVASGTITAARNGGTQLIDVTGAGVFGNVRLVSDASATQGAGTNLTTQNVNTSCQPPNLGVTTVCAVNGQVTFTVTNTSPHTNANQSYQVVRSNSTVAQSGTITAGANGGTQTITVLDVPYFGPLTLVSNGGLGSTTVINSATNCTHPPVLSASHICRPDGGAVLTITNTSRDSAANQPYEIRNSANTQVATGTVTAAANGGTQNITVFFPPDYGQFTFSTTGGALGSTTVVTEVMDCNQPPTLSATGACVVSGISRFVVTNTSPNTNANQTYQIVRVSDNSVVSSGTITAASNGGAQTINVTGEYQAVRLVSDNSATQGAGTNLTTQNVTATCQEPTLSATGTCVVSGITRFVVTNSSPHTNANQPYQIVRVSDNSVVTSGTITAANSGGTQTINVTGVYEQVRLVSDNSATQGPGNGTNLTTQNVTGACQAPNLGATTVCAVNGQVTFTVTNTSPHTNAVQSYQVLRTDNSVVTSGTINIPVGGPAQNVVVLDNAGIPPYFGPLRLVTDNSALQGPTTVLNTASDCTHPPAITATYTCAANGATVFVITNTSRDTSANQAYEIRLQNPPNTLIRSGTITAASGGVQTIIALDTSTPPVFGPLVLTSTSSPYLGVTTDLNVVADCANPPILEVTHVCQPDGSTVFTVTNTSPDTAASQPYTIRNAANQTISGGTGTLNIAPNGGTQVITVRDTNNFGPLTFTSTNPAQGVTTTVNYSASCTHPPVLSAAGSCQLSGISRFVITNNSNTNFGSNASQAYQVVRISDNSVVTTGTITAARGGGTQTVDVTGVYEPVRLESDNSATQGSTTNLTTQNVSAACTAPTYSINGVCLVDGVARFTVTNTSPNTNGASTQTYSVLDSTNTPIVGLSNLPLTLNAGANTVIDVVGADSGYQNVTISITGVESGLTSTASLDCAAPPVISVDAVCDVSLVSNPYGTAVFTVTNSSTESAANQSYTIVGGTVSPITGTITAPANNGTQIIVVPPAQSGHNALTLTTSGTQGTTTVATETIDCVAPPVLTPSVVCEIDGTAVFTITNTSTETPSNQAYSVTDENGQTVTTGTLTVPAGRSRTIRVSDVFGPITLTSNDPTFGPTTVIDFTSDCNEPPILTGGPTCTEVGAIFTVTNTSRTSDASQPYSIIDIPSGNVLLTGTLSIERNGGQQTIVVPNAFNPVRLETAGTQGLTTELTLDTDCEEPARLSVSATCSVTRSGLVATFTAQNRSLESAVSQPYTITMPNGSVAEEGSLEIAPEGGWQTSVPAMPGQMTFISIGEASTSTNSTSVVCRGITPDITEVERPEWENLAVGGDNGVCPDWMVYHTDKTGDWELFRYGTGADNRLAAFDPNLSQGRGEGVIDMMPSRSPDDEWIVFTSNRDSDFVNDVENWELYVAKVDNTVIRRVTFNTTARDIEPVWSPDGMSIIFESDRDGNWELYKLDIASGVETRLTDDLASDINAFWTPDSQEVVFQSNRDGLWQLYRLVVATGEVTQITDGTMNSHDPEVSFDGTKVAFRAINEAARSVIYAANLDGSDVVQVSDATANSMNHTWAPTDALIAYQSDLDGDMDIYVWEGETELTRLVTDNTIADYAPTWWCDGETVVFTSDILGEADIFNTPARPIEAEPILVETEANQMTTDPGNHIYPLNTPTEENASREAAVRVWIVEPPLSATQE